MQYSSAAHARFCLQTGLCRFLPIPFLDDWLIAILRRRMVKKVLKNQGVTYHTDVPRILTQWEQRTFTQKLGGFMKGLLVKPIKKLFRYVFFWLTIRDAGRTATESYLLVRMVEGLDSDVSSDDAKNFAKAFSQAVHKCDHLLAGTMGRKFWNRVWRRNRPERDPENTMAARLPGFLRQFDRRLEKAMAATSPENPALRGEGGQCVLPNDTSSRAGIAI